MLVLFGGDSPEREVSRVTARSVADALCDGGHDVRQLELTNGPVADLVLHELRRAAPDVVFLALHGGPGEDGRVQALLDLAGVPYTGSDARTSCVAMDKMLAKLVFTACGVPTPGWVALDPNDLNECRRKVADLGFPAVVKPAETGSTVGISVVGAVEGIAEAVGLARAQGPRLFAEAYVPGREITVGVFDGQALPVVEIVPKSGFYDYHAKYSDGGSRYVAPADLSSHTTVRLQQIAENAARALGCKGAPRVDFRLSEADEIFCLEVNTIPGMTPTSLLPLAAKTAGVAFQELVLSLCRMALRDWAASQARP